MSDRKWANLVGPGRLQEWRKQTGRSQTKTAIELGIDLASFNSFERGRERPGLKHAVEIEKLTNGYVRASHWIEELPVEAAPSKKRARRLSA